MKKTLFMCLFLCCLNMAEAAEKAYSLYSPSGEIHVRVTVSDLIRYDILYRQEPLLSQGVMQLELCSDVLGVHPRVTSHSTKSVKETLQPVVPLKFSTIDSRYNRLTLNFSGNYSVEFRAFDDGVAYRFVTNRKGIVDVANELFSIGIPSGSLLHVQQAKRFQTSYEEPYQHLSVEEWHTANDRYTLLPMLVETPNERYILISESDLTDYPAMFVTPAEGANTLTAAFPKNPTDFGDAGDRHVSLLKEAGYIARTGGKRSFPWRYFVIATTAGQLPENTMTARLAPPNSIEDTSWIKPGVTTWDWWNGNGLGGPDVDFVAGCNTATAKYFIDFASAFGVDYIMLDEGWAKSTRDPFTANSRLDLKEVIRYGAERNVGVWLWLPWLTVERNFGLFSTYAEWGIKGVKIDFMERSDQWMVNFYERVAAEAAKHRLAVDFHGSFKPAGLEYKYPNILSYEGVRGMEHMQNCVPDNTVYLPFIRNVAGAMDYTPGAMMTYHADKYPNTRRPNASHIGTRAHQMAMYVLFETGLQMMADSPTQYQQHAECARFMASIPVTTDETVSLAAKVGEYVVVAKRKGDKWYIGGITNSAVAERAIELPLGFLKQGCRYLMTSYEDGPNANRIATHYVKRTREVAGEQTVKVRMVRDGGFVAVLEESHDGVGVPARKR